MHNRLENATRSPKQASILSPEELLPVDLLVQTNERETATTGLISPKQVVLKQADDAPCPHARTSCSRTNVTEEPLTYGEQVLPCDDWCLNKTIRKLNAMPPVMFTTQYLCTYVQLTAQFKAKNDVRELRSLCVLYSRAVWCFG